MALCLNKLALACLCTAIALSPAISFAQPPAASDQNSKGTSRGKGQNQKPGWQKVKTEQQKKEQQAPPVKTEQQKKEQQAPPVKTEQQKKEQQAPSVASSQPQSPSQPPPPQK